MAQQQQVLEQPEQKDQDQQLEEQQEQEQEQEEQQTEIIEGKKRCMKKKYLKGIYKIRHNVWGNRARRRWLKAEYFSDRA